MSLQVTSLGLCGDADVDYPSWKHYLISSPLPPLPSPPPPPLPSPPPPPPQYGARRSVAVKVFLHELGDLADNSTVGELLEMSKEPRHLNFAYREIRQEVAFLSTLSHPHLTELVGVRTHPYMCLLLELAPKKSLRNLIKEYRDEGIVLEPLTLKNTVMQVCVTPVTARHVL